MRFFGLKSAVVALSIFLMDFVTKVLIHLFMPLNPTYASWFPYQGISVFKNVLGVSFSIDHTTNTGMAWGIFASHPEYLMTARVLFVGLLLIYYFFINKDESYDIPLTMVIAGALGNVSDFLIYGHVIDMLHFVLWGYDFPVFNVADSAIFLGVAWMFILSWGFKSKKKPVKARY
jgi:signal peptidase II